MYNIRVPGRPVVLGAHLAALLMTQRRRNPKPATKPTILRMRERLCCCRITSRFPVASACWALMAKKMAGMVQKRPIQPRHQNTAQEAKMASKRPWSFVP